MRRFLENAAPIILESRVLHGERFDAVVQLADELGLNRDQLACELRLLEQRGVITSAPWEQFDDIAIPPEAGDVVVPGTPLPPTSPAPAEATTTRLPTDEKPGIVADDQVRSRGVTSRPLAAKSSGTVSTPPPPPPAPSPPAARTATTPLAPQLDALRAALKS